MDLIASKFKVLVPMTGKLRQQELGAVDRATCVARREHACQRSAPSLHCYSAQDSVHREWCHPQWEGIPASVIKIIIIKKLLIKYNYY